jgi:hypothetical protein
MNCRVENYVDQDIIAQLMGLGAVIAIGIGTVFVMLRFSDRTINRRSGLVEGYPASLFSAQDITRSDPLIALTAAQKRILIMYEQVPPHSDMATWLYTFLQELREIMDTAYRVALIAQVYQRPASLDWLVAEVRQTEEQLADHVMERLLVQDGDAQRELLDLRLASLRKCVRELINAEARLAAR